jgi:hypothetical protein
MALLLAAVGFFVWSETTRPREIDWSETFRPQDRIPYGTCIAFNSLSALFPAGAVRVRRPVPEQLEQHRSGRKTAYCFVGGSLPFDDMELRRLEAFAAEGNYVFIAASRLPDTLYSYFKLSRIDGYGKREHRLLRPELSGKSYRFGAWFHGLQVEEGFAGEVLGTLADTLATPDFVRFRYGNGALLLNTNSFAFTNYWVLDSLQGDYYAKILSYLPEDAEIWWDEYKLEERESAPVFRVMLRYPALRHAWYLLLLAALLYLLFRIRREQRPIPRIAPPANRSVEFVAAVSALYYKERDHAGIARKQIDCFLDEMARLYRLQIDEPHEQSDVQLAGELAERSGADREKTERLFQLIGEIRRENKVGDYRLKELIKLMELFKHTNR